MHDVVILGLVDADEDLNVVAQRLAELTKVSREQAVALLQKLVVIKSNVDEQTAGRYQTALTKIGVRCEIRPKEPISLDVDLPQPAVIPPPIPGPTLSAPRPAFPPPDLPKQTPSADAFGGLLSCPGCGGQIHAQAVTCPHCGAQQKGPEGATPDSPMPDNELSKLTTKEMLIVAYLVIAAGFTVWNVFFGPDRHRSFAYNLGSSIVWPFQLFPILGQIVGGTLLVIFIFYFVILAPKRDD